MRVSSIPGDPGYVEDTYVEVTVDGKFFTLGRVLTADEGKGFVDYYVADEYGNIQWDPETGTWKRGRVMGVVKVWTRDKIGVPS